MNLQSLITVINWWLPMFLAGIIFLPFTKRVFNNFADNGYAFSKVIGIGVMSYLVFVFNVFHLLPFSIITILFIAWVCLVANYFFIRDKKDKTKLNFKIIIFEEILFLIGIGVWSYIRSFEPSINGLEKFMDFGFLNSILRSTYMPPRDMWFTPLPINYYYFGHFITAVLTKISFIAPFITFNLMIATLFSFAFSLTFSLGLNFISKNVIKRAGIIAGTLTALLLALGGNLHTLYSLFKPYNVDSPVPFWKLPFLFQSYPNSYWYPNATRFIPFTIHEFPIYSFVVSDLHGHVLDIPFVLLTIALSYKLFITPPVKKIDYKNLLLISLILAIMYMTNAWDAGIYLLLIVSVLIVKNWHILNVKSLKDLKIDHIKNFVVDFLKPFLTIFISFIVFSIPFNLHFDPGGLTHGIGILCSPGFLTKIGHIGPFLFEASHCQKTPWWQLLTLYGFFYFFVISFLIFVARIRKKVRLEPQDIFIIILICVSTILIIVPEFIYLKDIYPAHYRANTMFKLVYQAFIMLSLVSGYTIVRIISKTKNVFFYLLTIAFLIPIFVYPYFAIKSYYGDLKNYSGLDGINYLSIRYPEDYDAINWINKNIKGQPVMVEAQGDSYTDYERISANTGLPTILGWTVHEWLWRGSYNVPAPRITEVQNVYQSPDINLTRQILKKYNAKYIYVGGMERQKYPGLLETKFDKLGKVIYSKGQTKIYKLSI